MYRAYYHQKVWGAIIVAVVALVGVIFALQSDVLARDGIFSLPARAPEAPLPAPVDVPLVQQVGLPLDKEGPDQVNVLEVLTYTLTFTNTTGQTLDGVIITDTWTTKSQKYDRGGNPPLAEYNGNYQVSGVTVNFFTYTINTALRRGEATWILGPITPGVVGTIVFTMGVPDLLQPQGAPVVVGPSSIENSAAITTSTPGVRTGDDIVGSSVVGPVLELRKSFSTETGLSGGEHLGRIVTYTLQLKNLNRADSMPAVNIRISETLPSGLDFLTAWAAVPGVITGYESASRVISWVFPSTFALQPAETTYVTFSVRVSLDAPINQDIRNDKANCKAIADGMPFPITCASNVSLRALAPQYKVVQTSAPPNDPVQTYPNRPITYTVYIYNPYRDPVVNGAALDVLPPTFRFITMVNGPMPTTVETNTVLWTGLNIPGDGVISFTFRAWVGADTPVNINCNNKDYWNVMTTTLNGRVFMDDRMAQVWVVPQIKVSKSVAPNLQRPGETVVYTITLENRGNTDIPGPIIITDTLPEYFRFVRMVSSPPPGNPQVHLTDTNKIWWTDVPGVPAGAKISFSFEVQVDGAVDTSYNNSVSGLSPHTSICNLWTAGVKIDSPMEYRKEAIPPAPIPIVQGESFTYVFTQGNSSSVYAYTIDRFVDQLPDKFYANGQNSYIYEINPPFTLQPEWGNYWQHSFTVTVIGDRAGSAWCDNLGNPSKQTIYQEKGRFGVHTVSPDVLWLNRERASPVFILPHVSLGQEFYPNPAGFSNTVTVTLWLTNNLRTPPQDVTGVTVTYQLPAGFAYLGEVEGTPPPSVSGPYYTWSGITVTQRGTAAIRFRIRAPFQQGDFTHRAWARSVSQPEICIPMSKATLSVRPGVVLTKRPNLTSIGPYGVVEYTLDVENQTGASLGRVRITDTLPLGFQYVQHISGPSPISTSPPIWEVDLGPAGTSQAKVTIRFQVRTFTLVGDWYNMVDGIHPTTYVTRTTNYEDKVKLYVASGIGLFKTVEPTRTVAGEPVVYTITFYNGSDTALRNVRLTDTLPSGFTYAEMINGSTPVMTSPVVVWDLGNVAKGAQVVLSFRTATDPQLPRGFYYNRVVGRAEKAVSPYDPVLVPDTGETAPVYVQGLPTVERTKVVTPESVMAGERVTYTIYLFNEDPEMARTVRLTDTLPPSVTFVSVLPPTPSPVMTAPLVWDNIPVGAQQTVTLQFVAEVDYLARSGTYYNRLDAAVDGRALPPLAQLAPLNVSEIPRLDVQVSVDDGRLWVGEGDLLTYTVMVTNANEAGVSVEDTVVTVTLEPSDYLTVAGEGWTEEFPGVWVYPVGSLAAEGVFSAPLYVEVGTGIPPDYMTISTTAEVEYRTAGPVIEEKRANNRAVDIDILRGPDLVVTDLRWEPLRSSPGRPVTFYVTIRNQGTEGVYQRWDGSSDSHWLFIVELYAKGSMFTPAGPPQDVFDHAGGYCADAACSQTRYPHLAWPGGLAAGEERTLSFVTTLPVDTYRIYVQADVTWLGSQPWGQSFGLIREAIETNNVYDGGTMGVENYQVFLPLVLRNR